MIPKIIHYCWFGNNPLSELERNCIETWKTILPDYQICIWNEKSLDLNQYPFANLAYQTGKYAFVSDVVRLHALYYEGGIYLDTDMLVLKSFDSILYHEFFTGEYKKGALNAAVIGSIARHPLIRKLLDIYKDLDFEFLNPKTIPDIFDQVIWEFPDESLKVYSPEYFYPLPLEKKEENYQIYLTKNSFAVHLWNHSWKDEFVLLKENRFLASLCLAMNHVIKYPEAYRNSGYLNRYFTLLIRNLKRYGKLKISGNA